MKLKLTPSSSAGIGLRLAIPILNLKMFDMLGDVIFHDSAISLFSKLFILQGISNLSEA